VTEARRALGKRGEAAARAFLARRGVRILADNYTCSAGEIDLVGQEAKTLVFVEVKTRVSRAFGPPQLAVHRQKQQQIVRAAQWYLAEHRLGDVACRFDVLAVSFPDEEALPSIEWVRDAFPAEGIPLF
jgi:putative endonuclease